jgi:putative PEP-CTERM system TPR-repeat lipoprotein
LHAARNDRPQRARAPLRGALAAGAALLAASVGLVSGCTVGGEKLLARAEQSIETGHYRAAMIDLQNYLAKAPDDARARARLALVLAELGDIDRAAVEARRAAQLGASRELTIVPDCRVLIGRREFDQALAQCDLAGATPVTQGALTTIRGSAQYGKKDFAAARVSFEQALVLNPGDINALLGAANAAMADGDPEGARKVFEEAPAGLRSQPAYMAGFGVLERRSGRLERAEQLFRQAADTYDPKGDGVYDVLGALGQLTEVQLALDKDADAKATTDRMRKLAPDSPFPKFYAGLVVEKQNDLEQARALFEQAAGSSSLAPQIALARVNMKLGKLNQAESQVKDILEKDPSNDDARMLLLKIRMELGSPEEALEELQPAINASPGDTQLAMIEMQLKMQSGDASGAREVLERVESSGQADTPDGKIRLAAAYVAIGDVDHAMQLLDAVPDGGGTTEMRKEALTVLALLRKGERDAAITRADAMVARHPHDLTTRNIVAAIFTQARDYARARQQYAAILQENPTDLATRLKLADVELAAGDHDAAGKELQTVLASDPGNEQATLQMARVALAKKDAAEAERWGRKAIADHPKSTAAQLAFAQQMLAVRKFDESVQAAQAAVKLRPNDPKLLTMLGTAQAAKQDYAASEATFRKAVNLVPDQPGYRLNLARALVLAGKAPEALQTIDDALKRDPKSGTALGAAALLSLRMGDTERAAGYAERLSKLDPEAPAALRLEGRVAFAQKRYRDAAVFFDRSAGKSPSSSLTIERFKAAKLAGLPDADKRLAAWVEAHPADTNARIVLAEELNAEGQTAAAVRHYEAVLQQAPDSVVALNNLAIIYQGEKNPRAPELAKRAYDAAPANPMVADTYGWVLVDKGEVGQGIEILRKAAASAAATPEIHYHLAAALARNGQRDEALGILRKLKPGSNGYKAIQPDVERLMVELER